MIRFSQANTKLKKLYKVASLANWLTDNRKIYSFDLLSGWSCPAAKDCMSRAIQTQSGLRIEDGPSTLFRCFSASQEVLYTNLYNLRANNFEAIRLIVTSAMSDQQKIDHIAKVLQSQLPKNAGIVRIHVAGDFFNRLYFKAWLQVAINNPSILFYAYTKALNHWVNNRTLVNSIPNLVLTASYGGTHDNLISEYNLRYSKVVEDEIQASSLDIAVDDDDSHAADPSTKNVSFALVIHGVQPKGRLPIVS